MACAASARERTWGLARAAERRWALAPMRASTAAPAGRGCLREAGIPTRRTAAAHFSDTGVCSYSFEVPVDAAGTTVVWTMHDDE